jgi:hypothetical protein
MMNKGICGLLLLLSGMCVAQTGPFGFEKGMSRSQIITRVGQKNVDPRTLRSGEVLRVRTAPQPDDAFVGFMLLVSPQDGLLRVGSFGKFLQVGDNGAELKAAYDGIVAEITHKYGEASKKVDSCEGPAIICKRPSEWMLTMFGKQRQLWSEWSGTAPTPEMKKAGIHAIHVVATAASLSGAYVACDFELEGLDKYIEAKHPGHTALGSANPQAANPEESQGTGPATAPPGGSAPNVTPSTASPSTTTPSTATPPSGNPNANPPNTTSANANPKP